MTRLRRIELADVDVLDRQSGSDEVTGEHSWFGFRDAGRIASRLASGELITEHKGALAVADDDGTVVGEFTWVRTLNGPPPYGACWNIGIWIVPEHRRRGHGGAAQRIGADYLFAHTMVERVQASTEAGNVAEQRALHRAGFTREGTLRRACFRAGEWRDMVLFSKLRSET